MGIDAAVGLANEIEDLQKRGYSRDAALGFGALHTGIRVAISGGMALVGAAAFAPLGTEFGPPGIFVAGLAGAAAGASLGDSMAAPIVNWLKDRGW